MSHKKLSPFIVKVSVLGYFPLYKQVIHINNFLIIVFNNTNWCIHLIKYILIFLNLNTIYFNFLKEKYLKFQR